MLYLTDNLIADICDKSCFFQTGICFYLRDVGANSLESPFESHPERMGNEMWPMLNM